MGVINKEKELVGVVSELVTPQFNFQIIKMKLKATPHSLNNKCLHLPTVT
jgi:hypothetical protein